MNIIHTLVARLKQMCGSEEQSKTLKASVETRTTEGNIKWIRWRPQEKTGRKAIYCALSHENNFNEMNAITHMMLGLQQSLGYDKMPDVALVSADNSRSTMEKQVVRVLENESHNMLCMITQGVWQTYSVGKGFSHGLPAPLLYTGVPDIRNIRSLHNDRNRHLINGIQQDVVDYEEFAQIVYENLPGVRRILVPYDRAITIPALVAIGYGFNNTQREAFARRGFFVVPVPILPHENLEKKFGGILRAGDGVLIPNDTTALVGFEGIRRAANTARVPLFAENTMMVHRGASFGLGGNDSANGPVLANMVYSLDQGLVDRPCDLKTAILPRDQEVRFNERAFVGQDVKIGSPRLRAMRMRSIFAGE